MAETIDARMALALSGFVAMVAALMMLFGHRARPLQQRFAHDAARVGGELVDMVVNIWRVQALSACAREHARLRTAFGLEAAAQQRSWLYLEKARALHDLRLWLITGGMLMWAVEGWRRGLYQPGDVVLVSALIFRILHGSRELALSLVDASQQLSVIADMLGVVGTASGGRPARHRAAAAPRLGRRSHRPGRRELCLSQRRLDLLAPGADDPGQPASQRVGVADLSGAGKSTFVRLVARMADPTGGRVVLDGQVVADLRQDSLRRAITVVLEDVSLLHRSVMETLR